MGRTRKVSMLAFLLVLLAASLFPAAFAQSIPKPSVPEFTLKYIDNSHTVDAVTAFDPYTGKETVTEPGYYVQNKNIELQIKNQDFHPYEDADGHEIGLYYSIQARGHFNGSWFYLEDSNY